jgi:hypothetical protein
MNDQERKAVEENYEVLAKAVSQMTTTMDEAVKAILVINEAYARLASMTLAEFERAWIEAGKKREDGQ